MLPLIWSEEALNQLRQMTTYIAQFDETAAFAMRRRIEQSVLPACSYPELFRRGRIKGTREVVLIPTISLSILTEMELYSFSPSSTPARNTPDPPRISPVPRALWKPVRLVDAYVKLFLVNRRFGGLGSWLPGQTEEYSTAGAKNRTG